MCLPRRNITTLKIKCGLTPGWLHCSVPLLKEEAEGKDGEKSEEDGEDEDKGGKDKEPSIVSDLFQNSTKIFIQLQQTFHIQQIYSFNFNKRIHIQQIYSFNFNKRIHIQQIYSFNFNKRIHIQQIYSFNINKRIHIQQIYIHSTSTNAFIFNKYVFIQQNCKIHSVHSVQQNIYSCPHV